MGATNHLAKFFILANCCLAFGLLFNYVMPTLINLFIDKEIILIPSSKSYPMWKEAPVPIYQKFYFFNVTNAAEVEQFGQKPQLEEIGPFTYRTDWSKRDIEFDDFKSILTFKSFKQWQFEPELSIADHRLELVTLNAPLAITLSLIQNASNAIRLLVTFSLDGLSEGFFTKRSIKQLLFDGYPDLLTTFGPLLNAEMLSQGGHFGYMNARNLSQDGTFEINSGQDNIEKLNTINKFNGRSRLPYWHNYHHSNHCNSLEGSTIGELFPPIKNENENENHGVTSSIKLFQPDFCRVWRLDQVEKFQLSNGLPVRRFKATRDIFKNSTELPENSCYFSGKASSANNRGGHHHRNAAAFQRHSNRVGRQQQQQQVAAATSTSDRPQQQQQQHQHGNNHRHHSKLRQEWPNGVFTLAPCKFNAPIYMSMPHFLDADPYYSARVDGLAPDPQRHEFFVDLEPRTGSPVAMSVRVQLNVAISKPPGLVRFRHVPEIMFPVFWQELSVNLSESKPALMDQLLLASRGAQETNLIISYCFLLIGISILIITTIIYLHFKAVNSATTLTGSLSSSSILNGSKSSQSSGSVGGSGSSGNSNGKDQQQLAKSNNMIKEFK